jgi:glycerol-3-phosphate dehydrogenase (NAD(P)+)|tara:strand:- start:585 stop:1688 length:1104 start_codon:yes stop_codon:yes gene_type:complete
MTATLILFATGQRLTVLRALFKVNGQEAHLNLEPCSMNREPRGMRITVLGAGAWGTALTKLLHEGGHDVMLWGHAERLEAIGQEGRNEKYLPGIDLPANLKLEPKLSTALDSAGCAVVAVPSRNFRVAVNGLNDFGGIAVSVTKGIEHDNGLTMGGILSECAPNAQVAALSGPSLAAEVARGIPTALVSASADEATAKVVQDLFHRPTLRVYTSTDLAGVELGGALKNVVAIAAGVCDGLQFGDNAKAALITRGLAEMRRLGVACGARPGTFSGLSGMGDLTVTCFSKLSRNRTLGERLARGEKLNTVLGDATAEGHPTTRSAHQLAHRLGISTPIIDQAHAMLYEGKDVEEAVRDLLTRESKPEDD